MLFTLLTVMLQLFVAPLCAESTAQDLLAKHHLIQETDASCSLASITILLNSALELQGRNPYTQEEVLQYVNNPAWSAGTANGGNGASLKQLGGYLVEALDCFDIPYSSVTVFHYSNDTEEARELFKESLSGVTTMVIANFDIYDVLPVDEHIGHFSPVATYENGQFLVLDVAKDLVDIGWQNGPHWVDENKLFKGMHTHNTENTDWRGYVVLEL
ncbi:MAG: phytochelatin synthase family protein [Chlamydiales bacterium]|nr:phytochelatin synthase family protein [Chlamydiales bacterium]